MSKLIEAIKVYKKYGFDIRSGLNPYHFANEQPLGFPFTAFRKNNELSIISTGGGFLQSKSIYWKVYPMNTVLKISLLLVMLLVGVL